MNSSGKKIGIMGGTFDPIHIGHLVIAENACQQLDLEKVLFLPAGNPPHKREREGRATDKQRVEMVRRAIADNSHFELSLVEMVREGYSYTYQTLEELKEANPDEAYYFIIGADSLYDFKGWFHPERICACASIVVATRNHTDEELLDYEIRMHSRRFHSEFIRLSTRDIDISSRQLRAWVAEGRTIRYYVPDSVIDFIEENHIYWRGKD
ncbi:MAG: nicotinate-nucleotide adenylyltransferase [Lachnospiraceae bacterium]|nr:nicotinate-nucleotide adenylyltransferase [Lachnospiraceae bacterium]